mmetsp:Transcript_2937/g.7510  ORF Transcript_2937/g.7510 Transcript_2937/m.7510 type:complete len:281 (-) Transcript_2937:332-1174(-)
MDGGRRPASLVYEPLRLPGNASRSVLACDSVRHSLHRLQRLGLVNARLRVEVLKRVKQRTLFAGRVDLDLRVDGPSVDGFLLDAGVQQGLAVAVVRAALPEPVQALGHALEGGRGGMHAVVANVRLTAEPELPPLRQDLSAQRVGWGLLRVRGAEDLAAEVLPAEFGRIPLDRVVVDALARRGECAAHRHEEAVEDVELLAVQADLAAIESAAELHQLPGLLRRGPTLVELIGVAAELFASIHGVDAQARLQRVVPLPAEGGLELVLGDVELVRLEDGRL